MSAPTSSTSTKLLLLRSRSSLLPQSHPRHLECLPPRLAHLPVSLQRPTPSPLPMISYCLHCAFLPSCRILLPAQDARRAPRGPALLVRFSAAADASSATSTDAIPCSMLAGSDRCGALAITRLPTSCLLTGKMSREPDPLRPLDSLVFVAGPRSGRSTEGTPS